MTRYPVQYESSLIKHPPPVLSTAELYLQNKRTAVCTIRDVASTTFYSARFNCSNISSLDSDFFILIVAILLYIFVFVYKPFSNFPVFGRSRVFSYFLLKNSESLATIQPPFEHIKRNENALRDLITQTNSSELKTK